MPADVETMLDCASNYGIFKVPSSKPSSKRPAIIYTVSFSGSEGSAYCECPAYKWSGERRHCKHIDKAWHGACMYNPQWNEGHKPVEFEPVGYTYDAIVEGGKCPACNGPMVAVRRAV